MPHIKAHDKTGRGETINLRASRKQKVLIDRMRNSAMRAVFDPEMPADQRQAVINMLTGLMGATKQLPPPGSTTVTEEE